MSNFKTKEEYLQFTAAWKQAVKHDNNKRHIIERKQAWGGNYKSESWLNAEHYVFRNLMLKKNPRLGFTPKSTKKLQYDESPMAAYETALFYVGRAVKGNNVEKFLEPFEGKITKEHLAMITEEDLEQAKKYHK